MDKKKRLAVTHLCKNACENEWDQKERIETDWAHSGVVGVVGGAVSGGRCSVVDSIRETRDSDAASHTHARSQKAVFLPCPMDPLPISSYTIDLILQYISPPSQLARPIPPNLLSRSLLQRHALLEISPEDSPSYLSWPSAGRERAIEHLESLPMSLDELAPDFLVGYTVDPEHAYAHAHVKSTGDDGLRLVFEWDGEGSWKYHDANVMPFPPGTRPSFGDGPANDASHLVPILEFGGEKQNKDGDSDVNDDDDAYWNSYGVEKDDATQLLPSTSKEERDASEDAYWAQYASVQGMIWHLWCLRSRAIYSDHAPLKVRPTLRSHPLCTRKLAFKQHPAHTTSPVKGPFPSST